MKPVITAMALTIGLMPSAVASQIIGDAAAPATRTIQVFGKGMDESPPDVLELEVELSADGSSSDAALRSLVAKQASVAGRMAAATSKKFQLTNSEYRILTVREAGCSDDNYDDIRVKLETQGCAAVGYIARTRLRVRLANATDAGTVIGAATAAGADSAEVDKVRLSSNDFAEARATATAIADGRAKAEAIAAGAGVRLGLLRQVRDATGDGYTSVVLTGSRIPGPTEQPVQVDFKPEPIRTTVSLILTFEILGQ